MNLDFSQIYKEYSNVELLKVVQRPEEYEATAIAAATKILCERNVTTDDMESVQEYFSNLDRNSRITADKIEDIKIRVNDFLQPVLHPTDKVEPDKWLKIFLFVIIVRYAWALVNIVRLLLLFSKCNSCNPDIFLFTDILYLVYVPVIFFLLFKRKRWGWILLFADNLLALVTELCQSYLMLRHKTIFHADTTFSVFNILIHTAVLCFLWRDAITNHFLVDKTTKKNTVLFTTAATLIGIIILRQSW